MNEELIDPELVQGDFKDKLLSSALQQHHDPVEIIISGPSQKSYQKHSHPNITHFKATTAELMHFWLQAPENTQDTLNRILYKIQFPGQSLRETPPDYSHTPEYQTIADLYSITPNQRVFDDFKRLKTMLQETGLETLETLSQGLVMKHPRCDKLNLGGSAWVWSGQIYYRNNRMNSPFTRYFLTKRD